jgi:hypothetical protein
MAPLVDMLASYHGGKCRVAKRSNQEMIRRVHCSGCALQFRLALVASTANWHFDRTVVVAQLLKRIVAAALARSRMLRGYILQSAPKAARRGSMKKRKDESTGKII